MVLYRPLAHINTEIYMYLHTHTACKCMADTPMVKVLHIAIIRRAHR